MTSTEPVPPAPSAPGDVALATALSGEHAAIYAYGLISAHTLPENNQLVSICFSEHRQSREDAIAKLRDRSIAAPIAAAGYKLPFGVDTPAEATKLALQIESDSATAWRGALEQADNAEDRGFAVRMLTGASIRLARWRTVAEMVPASEPFPGGTEQ